MAAVKARLQRLEREWRKADGLLRGLDAGAYDHMFRDAETKAAVRADLEDQSLALCTAWLRADPEIEELADGAFRLKEYKNVVPFLRT